MQPVVVWSLGFVGWLFWCDMGRAGRVTNLFIDTGLTLLPIDFVLTPLLSCPLLLASLVLQPVIMMMIIGTI